LVGTSVKVVWNSPTSTGGDGVQITEYDVQVKDGSGAWVDLN